MHHRKCQDEDIDSCPCFKAGQESMRSVALKKLLDEARKETLEEILADLGIDTLEHLKQDYNLYKKAFILQQIRKGNFKSEIEALKKETK